jgi:hypothetical protein
LRLSRRPLPEPDASIARLSDEDRRLLVGSWGGRAGAELAGAESFRIIAAALRDLGAEPELQALAARAVDDELWHSEICHQVASIYAGRALPAPVVPAHQIPEHAGAGEALRRTLHVVGQCCINETSAAAFYETCLAGARTSLSRAALRALLSDEIDHARVGWAHLGSPLVDGETRAGVAAWLPSMIAANLRAWRERAAAPERAALIENGTPSFAAGDRAIVGALRDLLRPGFARLGFDVGALPSG